MNTTASAIPAGRSVKQLRLVSKNPRSIRLSEVEGLLRGRLQHRLPYLLTDDLAARKAAQQLGIRPIGSLGVIAWVWRLGEISLEEAERQMQLLQEKSSLFVTPAIVDAVIQKLTEYRTP